MFKILQKTFTTGIVTAPYPDAAPLIGEQFRGRPEFDFAKWRDARPAAEVCPTGAIAVHDREDSRQVTVDYGLCIFCGLCAECSSDGAVRITRDFELAARDRRSLVLTAEYALGPDGAQQYVRTAAAPEDGVDSAGEEVRRAIRSVLGRSLAIREVDAGSCNGCELEIIALKNPVTTLERLGFN